MPHSSGGGSHSGGSHGGSHSSSSSGSRGGHSGLRISGNRFPGAYRYVGYRDGRPDYVYSDSPRLNRHGIRWALLLVYIPFLLGGIYLGSLAIHIPRTMHVTHNPTVAIVDKNDMIPAGDEKLIEEGATEVYNATGVPVCVRFEDNSVWEDSYYSLERYAYDTYLDMYTDEDHWLVIYTDNRTTMDEDGGYLDWYFEGMQGDNTDKYLSESMTSQFNSDLHTMLRTQRGSIGQAFNDSFKNLAKNAKRFSINIGSLPMAFFWNIFIIFHMYFMVFHNPYKKYKDYVLCNDDEEDVRDWGSDTSLEPDSGLSVVTRCPHCGHVYYKGSTLSCPRCGKIPGAKYDIDVDVE